MITDILSNKNSRIVFFNIVTSFVIKGGGIFVGFLTTPAYMKYFENNSILGLWFAILSILNWILNFDMGIGNGLRNRIVYTMVEQKNNETKKYISSAYLFLIFIALLISIVTLNLVPLLNWNSILNISSAKLSAYVLEQTILIILISIILQFVLRLITSILFALQKAFVPNLLVLITNIILFLFVYICNLTGHSGNIVVLAIVYFFAVNIPLVVTTFYVFTTICKEVRPNIKFYRMSYAMDTLKLGSSFLLLQIESMLINNSSIFLITSLLGSALVVEYNIYFKIFYMIFSIYTLITTPIWSIVTKAIAENNIDWVKKIVRGLQVIALLFSLGQFILFPFMQFIVDIWLKSESIIINRNILIYFAFETTMLIWSALIASVCSGLNELKVQTILMTIGAILIIPLSYVLVSLTHSYISIVLAHAISLLPYCIGGTVWLENFFKLKINNEL